MRARFHAVVLLGFGSLLDCRTATDVQIAAFSEVDCARNARVAFAVAGDVAALRDVAPAAFSTLCRPAAAASAENDMGVVVVAPSSSRDASFVVALMTRPDGESPESCLDPKAAARCIVARRQLRFHSHEQVSLSVELRLSCLGVECPEAQTCVRGVCVDARVPSGCGADCSEQTLPKSTAPSCGDMRGLQAGAPWPMPGFCPTRPGRSGRNGPSSPTVQWRFQTGGIATSSPSVGADGTIYVGSNAHLAYAVDPSGREKWRAPVANNINGSGFVVGADDRVYVGVADGSVYAFDRGGAPSWVRRVGDDVAFPLAPGGDGTLFVAAFAKPDGQPLVALATRDGAIKWQTSPDFGVSGIGVGQDGKLHLGGKDARLHAVRPADGSTAWTADTGQPPSTPSVGDDGTVYVVADKKLSAFAPSGARRWQLPVGDDAKGVALGVDTVYVGTPQGVTAVSLDGTLRWKLPLENVGFQPGTVGGDGTLYVGGLTALHAISPSGTELWSVPLGGAILSQPALGATGTLYVASQDGNLYAIGP